MIRTTQYSPAFFRPDLVPRWGFKEAFPRERLRPSVWVMNISSFTVRWLSLFLGHCSTWANELFSINLLVCSVLKLLVKGGAVVRPQWSRCGNYCLWQVCLLWFVCEGPRQTPKGMLLPSPAQRVWAWSPAITPRVDSLLWKNSPVSMEPQKFCVCWWFGLLCNHLLDEHEPSMVWSVFTVVSIDELKNLFSFLLFAFSFFPVLTVTQSTPSFPELEVSLLPVGKSCSKICSISFLQGLWAALTLNFESPVYSSDNVAFQQELEL